MKRFILIALSVALIAAFASCRRGLESSIWAMPVLEQAVGAIELPDGVYSGIGDGYLGDIHVEVAIQDNAIVGIQVISHSDSPPFANSVFAGLIPEIMARQITGVDLTSGATYTARGLVSGIENALVAAGENLAALRTGIRGQLSFAAGTYRAVAAGYYDDIVVEVVFDASSIVSIAVVEHGDTPMFANMAFGAMIPAMLAAQSYDVDTVSGATATSNALREAVREAMDQAAE
ncbi:MAG: FMN-binding protein [Treponema sp.]|nr:FMN-binding protein [Treponema sp.]